MEKTKSFDLYLVEDTTGRKTAVRAPYLAGREGQFVCFRTKECGQIGLILMRIPTYKNDPVTQILFLTSRVYEAEMIFEPSWARGDEEDLNDA